MNYLLFEDPELGKITVKFNARSIRYTFRATDTGICITAPVNVSAEEIKKAFAEIKHKLPRLKEKREEKPRLEKGAIIKMFDFEVEVTESSNGNLFQSRFTDSRLVLNCPPNTNYKDQRVQDFFNKNLNKVLKYKANTYLPGRIKQLAAQVNETYNSCGISYGKSRLGRCDGRRNILLSCRLMMLPSELIDYIILHELAHLKEMNHGPHFHALLDKYCGGRHRELERKLKDFRFLI